MLTQSSARSSRRRHRPKGSRGLPGPSSWRSSCCSQTPSRSGRRRSRRRPTWSHSAFCTRRRAGARTRSERPTPAPGPGWWWWPDRRRPLSSSECWRPIRAGPRPTPMPRRATLQRRASSWRRPAACSAALSTRPATYSTASSPGGLAPPPRALRWGVRGVVVGRVGGARP